MKPFVSSVISPLLVAVLLVHALLGCCWHHGHEASRTGDASGPAAGVPGAPCQGEIPGKSPCGQRCVLSRPSSDRAAGSLGTPHFLVNGIVAFVAPERLRALPGIEEATPTRPGGGSLRSHLWYQVLLI